MEEWLADRVVTIGALQAAVAEHAGKGRRGVGVLRRLLETRVLGDLRADSGVEALLAQVLARHAVPLPELHHEARVGGAIVAELDYAYPVALVALEVDGYGVHLRSRETFEHDRDRQNELEIAGWRVLRFTSPPSRTNRPASPDKSRACSTPLAPDNRFSASGARRLDRMCSMGTGSGADFARCRRGLNTIGRR